jgi:GDPmannose 4,6-dehydratase
MALLIEIGFRLVGLDWREYVVIDKGFCRPTDLAVSRGNPSKAILVPRGYANERLGWVAQHQIADIVRLTILHRRGYC